MTENECRLVLDSSPVGVALDLLTYAPSREWAISMAAFQVRELSARTNPIAAPILFWAQVLKRLQGWIAAPSGGTLSDYKAARFRAVEQAMLESLPHEDGSFMGNPYP